MGRAAGFDRTTVIQAALDEFWSHGYSGTSTERLCAVTGLGRSSLYNAFHSKLGLYVACMTAYLDAADESTDATLAAESASAIETVSALLDEVIDAECERRAQGRPSGCFSVNTAVEAAENPEMAEPLRQLTTNLQARLADLAEHLAVGQQRGDIAKTLTPAEQAEVINGAVVAIRVASRLGAERPRMRAVADGALLALTPN